MIAGIDFSTKAVDVVLLDEDTDAAEWRRFELTGHDAFQRTRSIRTHFVGFAHSMWDDVLAVGIEDPRGYNAGALYRVQGGILTCIPAATLVYPWIPSEWRKQVGLPGNASKQTVAMFARERRVAQALWDSADGYRSPPMWPQDACDAYCIALATRQRLQYGVAA